MNLNESFADDKNSLNGSSGEDNSNPGKFSDFQDERNILKLAALNDKYKLV